MKNDPTMTLDPDTIDAIADAVAEKLKPRRRKATTRRPRPLSARATEVYEGYQLVSSYHARDIRVSGCPTAPNRLLTAPGCEIAAVGGCSAAVRRVRRRPALISLLWALASVWVGGSGRG